jgi:small multidrug resistance family-3 protein
LLCLLGPAEIGQDDLVGRPRRGQPRVFAWLLTRLDSDFAGRAYAADDGVYITASILWLWWVEGQRPNRWDLTGAAICLVGAAIILWGPRGA